MALPLCELQPGRLVLIKPSALGDIVHALPVLSWLRRRFPAAHISWVVNRVYEPLLAGHPHLDATLPFDRGNARRSWWGSLSSLLDFRKVLKQQQFDVAIDLQGLLRSGLLTQATRAARRVGLSDAREGAGWFYTDRVSTPGMLGTHAVDRYWHVAQAFGAGKIPDPFHLPVSPAALDWADDQLRGLPRPWLMVGLGSRWLTKRWLPGHFAELARRAQVEFGAGVVFLGTADEASLSAAVKPTLAGPYLDLAGLTTLPRLAALLARADLMLANDTGPLHLAVALGRPVVAPYTCTRARITGPHGQLDRAVETRVSCAGSRLKKCGSMACMSELTPDRLWPVLREGLSTWQIRSQPA